ncbi:hypothetical protein [Salinispora cortesiana]|uniref:hypothetical protein n=1 Tax=Salinispora cortesiana TaxID=1305843 RepID=UPI0004257D05|nr:hypothetical protein [Salinispora cortesiana]
MPQAVPRPADAERNSPRRNTPRVLPRWRRPDPPVPLAPRHRRTWRGLRRWCSCGLRWTACPDRHAPVPTEPPTPRPRNTRWHDEPTQANPQVGRAGRLTLAQAWRANGGHW